MVTDIHDVSFFRLLVYSLGGVSSCGLDVNPFISILYILIMPVYLRVIRFATSKQFYQKAVQKSIDQYICHEC